MPLLSISQPTFSPLSRFSKRTLDVVGARWRSRPVARCWR